MRKSLRHLNPASPEFNYPLAGLLVLIAVALLRNLPRLAPGLQNWAESGNVAAALIEGRGFSDPFAGGTGPTAWVPPGFVWLVAAVFALAGVKSAASALALLAVSIALLAAAHALLIACLPHPWTWARRVTSVAFLLLAALSPWSPLGLLSEAPLQILLSVGLLWVALAHTAQPRQRTVLVLTFVAILGPLTHAGLAVAVAIVLAALWLRTTGCARQGVLFAGALGLVAVAAWSTRNVVTLGKFVPLKSNFWFELHLANVASPGGFPRAETVLRQMPFFNAAEFERYAQLGELAYVDSFRAPSRAALAAEPARFLANIARRAASAFAFCSSADGSIATRHRFTPHDQARLAAAGELLAYPGLDLASWTRIDAAPAATQARFEKLGLERFPHILADWAEKHEAYQAQHYGPRGLLLGFALAGLPTLAWLSAALAARGRLPAPAGWAATLVLGMSLPYVLVNHSVRHQAPLLALHALALGLCAHLWIERKRPGALLRAP